MYQGAAPGRSGPGFTGSFGLPTKVVNQTLGFQTNHRINYTFVCRRFKNLSDKSLNIGQFCFVRRHAQPLGDHRLHTLVNLPQLNDLLYRCAVKRVAPKYTARSQENVAGGNLLDEWAPLGSVCTEVGYKVLNANAGDDQPQDRLINATVLGRCSTFNCWGQKAITDGCRLYMVLVRRPINAVIEDVDSGTWNNMLNRDEASKQEEGLNREQARAGNYCWQWVPYGNWMAPYPTAQTLGESMGVGDLRDTPFHAVYVGRVSSKGYVSQYASLQHTQLAVKSVDRLVTLPLFEVFIDYDTAVADGHRNRQQKTSSEEEEAAATAVNAAAAGPGATTTTGADWS